MNYYECRVSLDTNGDLDGSCGCCKSASSLGSLAMNRANKFAATSMEM